MYSAVSMKWGAFYLTGFAALSGVYGDWEGMILINAPQMSSQSLLTLQATIISSHCFQVCP